MRLSHLIVGCLLIGLVRVQTAHAIDCPPTQNACGTDKCCAVYDICTSGGRGACCPVTTPYACDDGTCAVTPTACGNEAEPLCPEYQINCGGVCIEAGSDCCNDKGDYCLPTQTCTADACTVAGTTRPRIHKGDPHAANGGYLMPTADPTGPRRTCAVAATLEGSEPPRWVLFGVLLGVWRRRRARHRAC